jgi:hypothetical protein
MGFEPKDIVKFVRAVNSLARKVSASPSYLMISRSHTDQKTGSSLISTIHADHLPLLASSPAIAMSPEAELLRRLLRISNGWWRISGLSSGRSGNVSGEVSRSAKAFSLSADRL